MIPKLFRSKIWHSRTFFVLLSSKSRGGLTLANCLLYELEEKF